jgi:YfiH family protein
LRWHDDSATEYIVSKGLKLLKFNIFKEYSQTLTHCFSTREGGVSTGKYSSLNLSFNREDDPANVRENFRILSKAAGIKCENMVLTDQIHDNKVRIVNGSDRGKGIIKDSDIKGVDALVTSSRQVALVTFYADCVPVLLYDTKQRVIGMAHSGWRGTLKQIANETIRIMAKNYNCNMADIIAAVGPAIGKCCFEAGNEVYESFVNKMPWSSQHCFKAHEDKWFIDLRAVIKNTLLMEGIKDYNISVSSICTKCNNNMFFSHRGDGGGTGCMAAVMQIN